MQDLALGLVELHEARKCKREYLHANLCKMQLRKGMSVGFYLCAER